MPAFLKNFSKFFLGPIPSTLVRSSTRCGFFGAFFYWRLLFALSSLASFFSLERPFLLLDFFFPQSCYFFSSEVAFAFFLLRLGFISNLPLSALPFQTYVLFNPSAIGAVTDAIMTVNRFGSIIIWMVTI